MNIMNGKGEMLCYGGERLASDVESRSNFALLCFPHGCILLEKLTVTRHTHTALKRARGREGGRMGNKIILVRVVYDVSSKEIEH